jgi:flagellar assembly protein FliH
MSDKPDNKTLDTRSAFERWEGLEAVPAPDPVEAEKRRIEEAYEAAREQGYAAGIAQAKDEARSQAGRFKSLTESYSAAIDSLDFRLSDQVLNLALDVARQVVAGELAARPERILDIVNLALRQMVETTREARLLLNPEDAAIIRPLLNEALDKSRLRIVEDVRIVRGGCLIETPQGDLDATLQARWRQVVAVLGSNRNWID